MRPQALVPSRNGAASEGHSFEPKFGVCGVGKDQVGGYCPGEVTLEVKGVSFWWLLHSNTL